MMSIFLSCFLIGFVIGRAKGEMVKVNAVINGPAILPCKVSIQGVHNTVYWYKNPNTLISMGKYSYNKRMSISQEYEGEWNIDIKHVQVGDAGEYTCKVGKNVMAQVDLVVKSPPMIHETHDITFDEGVTGTLWCNVTGFPTPTVRWYWKSPHQVSQIEQAHATWRLVYLVVKEPGMNHRHKGRYCQAFPHIHVGLVETPPQENRDSGAEGARLVLHNITRYYDNIYICVANNSVGTNRREVRVHVKFGPDVEVFQDIVNATGDQEVNLHCAIEAYPMEGELEWFFEKNSKPIRAGRKYDLVRDRSLVMDFHTQFLSMIIRKGHLGVGDYGKYICRTKNFNRGSEEKVAVIQKPTEDQNNVDDITDINV